MEHFIITMLFFFFYKKLLLQTKFFLCFFLLRPADFIGFQFFVANDFICPHDTVNHHKYSHHSYNDHRNLYQADRNKIVTNTFNLLINNIFADKYTKVPVCSLNRSVIQITLLTTVHKGSKTSLSVFNILFDFFQRISTAKLCTFLQKTQ